MKGFFRSKKRGYKKIYVPVVEREGQRTMLSPSYDDTDKVQFVPIIEYPGIVVLSGVTIQRVYTNN